MLADGAVGWRMVVLDLEVRRLFCDNSHCERVTFAEQVEGLTQRYQRRTPLLHRLLAAIGIVLSGLPGGWWWPDTRPTTTTTITTTTSCK
jgi:hypothetical protein